MKTKFLFFVSLRYFKNKKKNRHFASSILSILGVTAGVMTLIVVLAVMNGFQSGFISSILDISSYHIRISGENSSYKDRDIISKIERLKSVSVVVPFNENQAIVKGVFTEPEGCIIRGVPADIMDRDESFKKSLKIENGVFSVRIPGTAVIGVELARRLGVSVGDKIEVLSISENAAAGLKPIKRYFIVSGLFKSGYYEFDLSWIFVSLSTAGNFFWEGKDYPVTYGLKLVNRFRDEQSIDRIKKLIKGSGLSVVSWREYNRSFFDALLMEKIMMMLLLGLIFVVVGFNIYHSLRRMVYEKIEDIAIIKALGASPSALRYIFIVEGFLIGLFGAIAGTCLGLLVSININEIFSIAEAFINGVFGIIQAVSLPFVKGSKYSDFTVFSPMYFYLTKVPVTVRLPEVIVTVFSAVFASSAAAYFASRKISTIKPVEVLRYQ